MDQTWQNSGGVEPVEPIINKPPETSTNIPASSVIHPITQTPARPAINQETNTPSIPITDGPTIIPPDLSEPQEKLPLNFNFKKISLIALGVLIILAGVYFFFFYQARVNISVNPNSAKIEIGAENAIGSTQLKFKPGQYDLKITLTDYVSYEKTLQLKPSQRLNLNIDLNRQPDSIKLVDYPAKFISPTLDKKSLVYLSNEGRTIYKIDGILEDTKQKPFAITPQTFNDVRDIKWNLTNDLALIKQQDRWYLYDFKRYDLLNQEIFQWPEGIGEVAWSPDGEKIVYFFNTSTEKTLIRASKDNSNMERIYNLKDTNISNPKIVWSADGQKILLVEKSIFVFDVYTKSLTQLAQFEDVTAADFTPDSQSIIYEVGDALYTTDLEGKEKMDLKIAAMFEKTVWLDNDNLVYFILGQKGDELKKLNIKTMETTVYTYNQNNPISAVNPLISLDQNKIFFNQGEFVYSLKLISKDY